MKSAIAALALLLPFSALAHPGSHFDLKSYNGDYQPSGHFCGYNLEFSRNLLVATAISVARIKCNSENRIKLFDCDVGTGECRYQKNKNVKIILLENGDFIVDNGDLSDFFDYEENTERRRYVQFSRIEE